MTKEELEKEVEEYVKRNYCENVCTCDEVEDCKEGIRIRCMSFNYKKELIVNFAESREKHIAELEEKISILLSCKNCPNNKGGYICEKEYEEKCLSQKIQYIKELQEELKKWKDEWQEQVQKENDESYARTLQTIQLNKAKELIKNIIRVTWNEGWNYSLDWKVKAEDFLKENK